MFRSVKVRARGSSTINSYTQFKQVSEVRQNLQLSFYLPDSGFQSVPQPLPASQLTLPLLLALRVQLLFSRVFARQWPQAVPFLCQLPA